VSPTETQRVPFLPPDRQLGWTPYAWLVYSLPFLILPFWFRVPWQGRTATVAAWLVFLYLYFRGYWVSGRRLLPIMAALVLLGVLFIRATPRRTASSSTRPLSPAASARRAWRSSTCSRWSRSCSRRRG
jgi:hypothetical protein